MNLHAGQAVEFKSLAPITQEQLKAYAQASGDYNPIHTDEVAAKKAGLPGVIVHGMLSAGFLAERAEHFVFIESGLKDFKVEKFQSRFKAMTFPGDVVSLGGVVREAGEAEVVLDLQAKNQRGEVTTTSQVRFVKI